MDVQTGIVAMMTHLNHICSVATSRCSLFTQSTQYCFRFGCIDDSWKYAQTRLLFLVTAVLESVAVVPWLELGSVAVITILGSAILTNNWLWNSGWLSSNNTTRGWHSNILCTQIFVLGLNKSQQSTWNILHSQRSSYYISLMYTVKMVKIKQNFSDKTHNRKINAIP